MDKVVQNYKMLIICIYIIHVQVYIYAYLLKIKVCYYEYTNLFNVIELFKVATQ